MIGPQRSLLPILRDFVCSFVEVCVRMANLQPLLSGVVILSRKKIPNAFRPTYSLRADQRQLQPAKTPDGLIMIDCGISRKKFCVGLKN